MNLALLREGIADDRTVSIAGIGIDVSKRSDNDTTSRSRQFSGVGTKVPDYVAAGERFIVDIPDGDLGTGKFRCVNVDNNINVGLQTYKFCNYLGKFIGILVEISCVN